MAKVRFLRHSTGETVKLKGDFSPVMEVLSEIVHLGAALQRAENHLVTVNINYYFCDSFTVSCTGVDRVYIDGVKQRDDSLDLALCGLMGAGLVEIKAARRKLAKKYLGGGAK